MDLLDTIILQNTGSFTDYWWRKIVHVPWIHVISKYVSFVDVRSIVHTRVEFVD